METFITEIVGLAGRFLPSLAVLVIVPALGTAVVLSGFAGRFLERIEYHTARSEQ
jgi:hypothetical protein